MLRFIYLLFFLLLTSYSFAQNRGNIWCFGDSAGIDFNNPSNPAPISTGLKTRGSCASISDSAGQLQFYSDNRANASGDFTTVVYNNQHNLMPNGDSLVGEGWYNEITIIPFPNNDSLYYIFHLSTHIGPSGLYYSIVNMNADNGLGDVMSKNNQLQNFPVVDCLSSIKHGNGRDWWVIFRKYDGTNNTVNNEFHKYLITPNGIANYSIQNIGSFQNTGIAQLKFNNTGDRLCFSSYKGTLELFDFNRCNGTLSNSDLIYQENSGPPWPARWSCEFSNSGQYLYVSSHPDSNYVFQYDLNSANIISSEQILWTNSYPFYSAGLLKIAPDNKIYFSSAFQTGATTYPYPDTTYNLYNTYLGVINEPNIGGVNCDFQPFSFYLGGKRTYWGLPNNPDYDLGPFTGSPCDTLVGIQENENSISTYSELFIYYSPEWQAAFINAKNLSGKNFRLEIFDSLGKKVHSETGSVISSYYTKNLNCEMFASGMYIVKLETEKKRMVKRFVIK